MQTVLFLCVSIEPRALACPAPEWDMRDFGGGIAVSNRLSQAPTTPTAQVCPRRHAMTAQGVAVVNLTPNQRSGVADRRMTLSARLRRTTPTLCGVSSSGRNRYR